VNILIVVVHHQSLPTHMYAHTQSLTSSNAQY